jgi:pSer/pThr/pTyr-binding forkhead associated (FHA) protein
MNQDKEIYVKDAKSKLQEEFVEKYNHPFLIRFAESPVGNIDKRMAYATIAFKTLDDILKMETKAQNNDILEIIPVVKTARNPFQSKIIVGRTSTQDIIIDDLLISKFHAYFEKNGDNDFFLIERGSTNGTLLNGVKLENSVQNKVKDQDKISFGGMNYVFFSSRSTYMALKK